MDRRRELRLFDSPTEELSRLSVDEIIGGYYRQVGVVWNGGRSLATARVVPRPASGCLACPSCPIATRWPKPRRR